MGPLVQMKSVYKLCGALILMVFAMEVQAASASLRRSVHSAARHPHQSYVDAARRYLRFLPPLDTQNLDQSAMGSAKPLAEMDVARIPEWKDGRGEPLFAYGAFRHIRDWRFLSDPDSSGFMRRSSWMYPDDGCFARAALMSKNLSELKYGPTAKAFAFGNLTVKSSNAVGGFVSWWYHVVPVIRVVRPADQATAVLVFDPAIEPSAPILIQKWVTYMTSEAKSLKIAICHQNTYVPSEDCQGGGSNVDARALRDQMTYLTYERQRLVDLKRDPEHELGDFPPWSRPAATLSFPRP